MHSSIIVELRLGCLSAQLAMDCKVFGGLTNVSWLATVISSSTESAGVGEKKLRLRGLFFCPFYFIYYTSSTVGSRILLSRHANGNDVRKTNRVPVRHSRFANSPTLIDIAKSSCRYSRYSNTYSVMKNVAVLQDYTSTL